jgi:hypothetical protein
MGGVEVPRTIGVLFYPGLNDSLGNPRAPKGTQGGRVCAGADPHAHAYIKTRGAWGGGVGKGRTA